MKYIQLKQSELSEFRAHQLKQQNYICPVLKIKLPAEKAVVDHKHRKKSDPIGQDGDGLIRGVIHSQANVVEGKVSNAFRRYGLHKFITLPEFLRNLADYIENPPAPQVYIHPDEILKPKKLGKRQINKVLKHFFEMYPNKKKLPKVPKSMKITKDWQEYLDKLNEI